MWLITLSTRAILVFYLKQILGQLGKCFKYMANTSQLISTCLLAISDLFASLFLVYTNGNVVKLNGGFYLALTLLGIVKRSQNNVSDYDLGHKQEDNGNMNYLLIFTSTMFTVQHKLTCKLSNCQSLAILKVYQQLCHKIPKKKCSTQNQSQLSVLYIKAFSTATSSFDIWIVKYKTTTEFLLNKVHFCSNDMH